MFVFGSKSSISFLLPDEGKKFAETGRNEEFIDLRKRERETDISQTDILDSDVEETTSLQTEVPREGDGAISLEETTRMALL